MLNEVKKTVDEKLEKMVDEAVAVEQQVKKADAKAEEKVAKNQQKVEEYQKEEEATVPNAEVKTQSNLLNN
ncbi:hypothetical protein Hanom_Chr05g00423141 [Helianthus anomalus]